MGEDLRQSNICIGTDMRMSFTISYVLEAGLWGCSIERGEGAFDDIGDAQG